MATTQATAGQALTAALRRYFSIGTRTRRYRTDRYGCRQDLHCEMVETIMTASQYPGAFVKATEDALHAGFGAALAYQKHVQGYRISGALAQQINALSPWQFAAMLGQMVDAGVANTGAGERFFSEMSRAA